MNNCNLTCVTVVVLLMILASVGLLRELRALQETLETQVVELEAKAAMEDLRIACLVSRLDQDWPRDMALANCYGDKPDYADAIRKEAYGDE